MANKIRDPFAYLHDLPMPRPFVWYGFVKLRRTIYSLASLMLLLVCVGGPMLYFVAELNGHPTTDRGKANQIALYFGALVVVAFVRYSYVLHKLWDDSKWLARNGRIEEANLLWVIKSEKRLVVTYRFWTPDGVEIQKETVIDADGNKPLAELKAGDVVPALYDTKSPRRRSMLWAEIERYVTQVEAPARRARVSQSV
jgi:hypothetical protein